MPPSELLLQELARPGNEICADCAANKPDWASINIGVFLCVKCSGIHRNLGTHISQVRSVDLDDWQPQWLHTMQGAGNRRVNEELERHITKGHKKPRPKSGMPVRQAFIIAKYTEKAFTTTPPPGYDPEAVLDTVTREETEIAANLPSRRLSQLLAEQEAKELGLYVAKDDESKKKEGWKERTWRGKKNLTRAKQWAKEQVVHSKDHGLEPPDVKEMRHRVNHIASGHDKLMSIISPVLALNQTKVRGSSGSGPMTGMGSEPMEDKKKDRKAKKPYLAKMVSAAMAASTRMANLAKTIGDVQKHSLKCVKLRLTYSAAIDRAEGSESTDEWKRKAELRKTQYDEVAVLFLEKGHALEADAEAGYVAVIEATRTMLRALQPGWRK